MSASQAPSRTRVPTEATPLVLGLACVGFALWGVGWLFVLGSRTSHLGWALQVVGPRMVARAVALYASHLRRRIGYPAVLFGSLGAVIVGLATLPYGISQSNLSSASGLRFGYAAYGIGLLLGALSLTCVAVTLGRQLLEGTKLHPAGCSCSERIHSSMGTTVLGAAGLLVWGLGFLALFATPEGSRYGWILAVVGSAAVSVAIAGHLRHLSGRFGQLAAWLGIISAFAWSIGYLLQAIHPTAGFYSQWYSALFGFYGAGHILSAVSIALVLVYKLRFEPQPVEEVATATA